MWFSPIFDRFVVHSPVTVMVRAIMEVVLAPSKLDALFEQTAKTGYTRELLFSTLVMMMTNVVCGMHLSYWLGLQGVVSRNWRVENGCL
jgi:hypothetical protein